MPVYCELPIWGDVFEPLNTISNLAFIVSAYFVWRLRKEVGEASLRRQILILASILAAIGLGSGLWHFYRESWALALDIIPIQLFLLAFLWFFLSKLFTSVWLRICLALAFIATTVLVPVLIPIASGYLGSLVFAFLLGAYVYYKYPAWGRYFITTLVIFSGSLILRQSDLTLCDVTRGHGSHLLWHILNAYVLYRFARLLMLKSGHYS